MLKYSFCFFSFILFSLINSLSFAGAWMMENDSTVVIHNFFVENQQSDNSREYSKFEYKPYIESVFRDDLSFILSPSLQYIETENDTEYNYNEAKIPYIDFALKKNLMQNNITSSSIWFLLKIPTNFDQDNDANFSNEQFDAELRAMNGINYLCFAKIFQKTCHINSEIAYRKRFDYSYDEVRIDISNSVKINDKFSIIKEIFYKEKIFTDTKKMDIVDNRDYYQSSSSRIQLSFVASIDENKNLQLGLYSDILDEHRANGILFSIWHYF